MLIIFTKASTCFQEIQVIFLSLGKSLSLDCDLYRPCYIDFIPSLKRVLVIFILTIYIRSVMLLSIQFYHMTLRLQVNITPSIKIDKPLVVNRFSGNVMK